MRFQPAADVAELLTMQSGLLTRAQALSAGVPSSVIDNQLRAGRWQRLHNGVYATYSGRPGRDAELWAAVLRAGSSAALSHRTAAELNGLTDEPSQLIHITIPAWQRTAPMAGAVLHRSRAFTKMVHPTLMPPRTTVEHTTLDLTQSCKRFEDAFGWLCRAVGRGLTTPELLRSAMSGRARVRWRADLELALGDIGLGVRSPLERRYVADVERPHGLPKAERQAKLVTAIGSRYADNLYRLAGLAVELDGRAAHPPEQHRADSLRDNAHAGLGIVTLRYGWTDVTSRPCAVATEIAALLNSRGQPVRLTKCGPTCPVEPWASNGAAN
jgi:very-short-patch-repair endonuclease